MARGDYAPVEQENEQVTDYVSLRGVLIWQLEHDSAAHESGDYDQIGKHFDSVAECFDTLSHYAARGSPESNRLNTAMAFWSAWIGARWNNWQNRSDIKEAEWPLLARRLAADLAADRDASDPTIQQHFDVSRYQR